MAAIIGHPELRQYISLGRSGDYTRSSTLEANLRKAGKYSHAAVWQTLVDHHLEHGSIPDAETWKNSAYMLASEMAIPSLSPAPSLQGEIERIIDYLTGEDASQVSLESAIQAIQVFFLELLVRQPLGETVMRARLGAGLWHDDLIDEICSVRDEIRAIPTAHLWQAPVPLEGVEVPTFPVESLPPRLQQWVTAVAISTETPVDLPAMLSLAVCGAACGSSVEIVATEDWRQHLNLYTVVIMSSGSRKSPVFRLTTAPLHEIEQRLSAELAPAICEREARRRVISEQLKRAERAGGRDEGADTEAQMREVTRLAEQLRTTPPLTAPRLIVDDTTQEQLEVIMANQGGHVLLAAPEGGVFSMMTGRYSNSTNLNVYLQGYSGDPIRTDRVGRDSVLISRPALSMALTVQPHVIQGLGRHQELRGRGLLARCWFAVPPNNVGRRQITTRESIPLQVSEDYSRLVHSLYSLQRRSTTPCAVHTRACPPPITLRLTPDAQEVLTQFELELEAQQGPCGDLAAITDWVSKAPGLVLRIAGILHVISAIEEGECAAERQRLTIVNRELSPHTLQSAIAIVRYAIRHAKVAFGMMAMSSTLQAATIADAQYILDWIRRKRITTFQKRDVQRRNPSRFPRVVELEPALQLLVDRNYLRREEIESGSKGGRPTERYFVNPAVGDSTQ